MYWIQYFCPREAPFWQDLTEGLIFKTRREFPSLEGAKMVCNSLLYRFHSARVIDPSGRPVYQI